MQDLSEGTLETLGLENLNDTDAPCDWYFIACTYGRVTSFELNFRPARGDYINTSYWPSMIENIYLDVFLDIDASIGPLILDNLPTTIQNLSFSN